MDLTDHFRVILHRKWRILAATVLVAGLVFAWRSSVAPTYQATALLKVTSASLLQGNGPNEQDTKFLTDSYAAMAATRPVVIDAIARSGLDVSPEEAERRLSSSAQQAGFITISASGPDGRTATALARGLALAINETVATQQQEQLDRQLAPVLTQIGETERKLAEVPAGDPRRTALEYQYQALVQNATEAQVRPVDRLTVITPARAEPAPVSPRPKRDAILALLAALVINAEAAVALSLLGGRFDDDQMSEQVTALTGLPVLGTLPQASRAADEQVVEAFRSLRTNLLFLGGEERGLETVAIVGGERGSGKSFVAENICRTLVDAGTRAVLIDGDLRNPVLHTRLRVELEPGLAEAITPPYEFPGPVDVPDSPGFRMVPAGATTGDPAASLGGKAFSRLIERLRFGGMVVVDTPPLRLFADAVAIARSCDATVLVLDAKTTRKADVERMLDTLNQVGVVPLGVVINRAKTERARSYEDYRRRRQANQT